MKSVITPDHFPLLLAAARNGARFAQVLEDIAAGVASGSIRNAVLNEAKHIVSGAVYAGWYKYVVDAYFGFGKSAGHHPPEVIDLYHALSVGGVYDVLAVSRNLAKTTAQGAAVDSMRAFVMEVMPLAEALSSLKDKVVKGRALPAASSRPTNPNKIIKTCPCCFRAIAVKTDKMFHHGYTRPFHGWQSASCPGIQFRPLEVSSEGLEWLINVRRARLGVCEELYMRRHDRTSLLVLNKHKKLVNITINSLAWTNEFKNYVFKLECEISALKSELPFLENRLAAWLPEVKVVV